MTRRFMAATLVLALMSMSVHTDADETAAPKPATAAAPSAPVKADASGDRAGIAALPVVTRHVGVFGGRRITYDAVVEQTLLPNAKGNPPICQRRCNLVSMLHGR